MTTFVSFVGLNLIQNVIVREQKYNHKWFVNKLNLSRQEEIEAGTSNITNLFIITVPLGSSKSSWVEYRELVKAA